MTRKNSTKIVPKKQSDPTLEPNGLKNSTNAASQKTYPNFFGLEKCHNNRLQYPVQGGYNKKPIGNFSDLKNVTNAASHKTYPNYFGLEKCHE